MPEETPNLTPTAEADDQSANRVNQAGNPVMRVKIYSPYKNYFDKDAESVSAVNETGDFDILPHHKNFMTLLLPGEITVRNAKDPDYRIKISRGIMHVKADKVVVFLDV